MTRRPDSNASPRPPRLMFIAGEASGDNHAAALIRELKAQRPDAEIFGAGGTKMRDAGMELLLDLTQHAVVGLVEVLKNYGTFRKIFNQLVTEAKRRRPDAVILTDYPGFNLRFAAQMKRRGIRVIYFISPQVWAWHANRAQQIERDVDLMLTIFPFEKAWYAAHAPRLKVEFIGHPMLDRGRKAETDQRKNALIALLPGSREREVRVHWPLMLEAARRLSAKRQLEFVALAANDAIESFLKTEKENAGNIFLRVSRDATQTLSSSTLAVTASGTATMECAFFGCPMVVVYRVNWLTYLVGRAVVKVNWLAMPNVIAGKEIVPELLQHRATPDAIEKAVAELLDDDRKRETMRRELETVITQLGAPGASERAAEAILSRLAAV